MFFKQNFSYKLAYNLENALKLWNVQKEAKQPNYFASSSQQTKIFNQLNNWVSIGKFNFLCLIPQGWLHSSRKWKNSLEKQWIYQIWKNKN